jgi:hypothetical protein
MPWLTVISSFTPRQRVPQAEAARRIPDRREAFRAARLAAVGLAPLRWEPDEPRGLAAGNDHLLAAPSSRDQLREVGLGFVYLH